MTLDEFTAALEELFDVQTSTAQGWVQEAYRRAVAESKWLGTGNLVPADLTGTDSPVFPVDLHPIVLDGAIAIGYLRVDERPDEAAVHEQRFRDGIAALRARKLALAGERGAQMTRDEMTAAITAVIDVDTSTAAGWVNQAYKQAVADSRWFGTDTVVADLATGTGSDASPVFPADLHGVVLDGAFSIGLLRTGGPPDRVAVHEQRFQDGVRKLRARKIRRMRGPGPFRAQFAGKDFDPV